MTEVFATIASLAWTVGFACGVVYCCWCHSSYQFVRSRQQQQRWDTVASEADRLARQTGDPRDAAVAALIHCWAKDVYWNSKDS